MNPLQHHFFRTVLLPDGWRRNVRMSVRQGIVERIETETAAVAGDACHELAIPGLPNLHSHAFQRGMAGLTERRGPTRDSFWTWRDVMYRFVERLEPEDVAAIASLAYMEMLESGFTRVGEFNYLHHDRRGRAFADPAEMSVSLASAADATGIALTLLPVFYAHAGFGGVKPAEDQKRFICDIDLFSRIVEGSRAIIDGLPDAVLGIAPHSLRAVTPDELKLLAQFRPQGVIHIHVAEQTREVEDCLAWSGARPVEWLLDNVDVDGRWCLVHATHMQETEIARFAASGAVAGLCPITEANLGDGLFEAVAFIRAGGRYGVGSDSNVLIDAAQELCILEYGQRLRHGGRNMLSRQELPSTGDALYRTALVGGAQALGCEAGLRVGSPADFVVLDRGHPSLSDCTSDTCLDRWIFAAGRQGVDGVWRRGDQLVSQGRHRARDAIVAAVRQTIAKLTA